MADLTPPASRNVTPNRQNSPYVGPVDPPIQPANLFPSTLNPSNPVHRADVFSSSTSSLGAANEDSIETAGLQGNKLPDMEVDDAIIEVGAKGVEEVAPPSPMEMTEDDASGASARVEGMDLDEPVESGHEVSAAESKDEKSGEGKVSLVLAVANDQLMSQTTSSSDSTVPASGPAPNLRIAPLPTGRGKAPNWQAEKKRKGAKVDLYDGEIVSRWNQGLLSLFSNSARGSVALARY
jgi:hypothetical protein